MSGIRMHVLEMRCNHCSERIEVEVPEGDVATFSAKLAEVERLAEEKHRCPKAPKEDVGS